VEISPYKLIVSMFYTNFLNIITPDLDIMGLDKIKEIKESYSDKETNSFLRKGFKLLKILSTRKSNNTFEEIKPCYILGK
jgi:hypothetical protein